MTIPPFPVQLARAIPGSGTSLPMRVVSAVLSVLALSTGLEMASFAEERVGNDAAGMIANAVVPCLAVPGAIDARVTAKVTVGRDGKLLGPPIIAGDGNREALRVLIPAVIRAIRRCSPYSAAVADLVDGSDDYILSFSVGEPPADEGRKIDTYRLEDTELRIAVPLGYCRLKETRDENAAEQLEKISDLLGPRLLLLGYYLPCDFLQTGRDYGEDAPGWTAVFVEKTPEGAVWRDQNLPLAEMINRQRELMRSSKSIGLDQFIEDRIRKFTNVDVHISGDLAIWTTDFAACSFMSSELADPVHQTIRSVGCHTLIEGYRVSVAVYTPSGDAEALNFLFDAADRAISVLAAQSTPAQ
jgi:hypothetical protein